MRRCKFCKSKAGETDSVCQFCGDEEFIVVDDEAAPQMPPPLSPTSAPKVVVPINPEASRPHNACCPNPDCAEKIVPMHERYCTRCDQPLEFVSNELWITKVVKPAFNTHTGETLTDPLRLLTSAEDIGLETSEAEKALAKFFVELSGKNHHVIQHWVNSSVLPLVRKNINDESAQSRAVADAESKGISTDFAEHVIKKLSSRGEHKSDFFAEIKLLPESERSGKLKTPGQINAYKDTDAKKRSKFRWLFFWRR